MTTVAQQVRVAVENARLYRERQESLRSYVSQVTQAQEEERLRIARELHDETAQELVRLVRKLEQLRRPSLPDMTQPIDDLLNLTRDILQAVRRYSRDLRPSVLDDLGLLAAIEMLIDECRLPGGGAVAGHRQTPPPGPARRARPLSHRAGGAAERREPRRGNLGHG